MRIIVVEGELSHAFEFGEQLQKKCEKGELVWIRDTGEAGEEIAQLLKKGAMVISEKRGWLNVIVLEVPSES